MLALKRTLIFFSLFMVISPLASNIVSIKSADHFKKLYNGKKPMVAMYTASWCGPCQNMKPHFIKSAQKFPQITFCLVDTENSSLKGLCSTIKGLPTTIFSYNGINIMQQQGGLTRVQLNESLERFQSMIKASLTSKSTKKTSAKK